jgi:hypothetical protein
MAKIVLSSFLKEVHGKMDTVVFRKVRGKYVMGPLPPSRNGIALSEAQTAHQDRFNDAVEFGKDVLADDTIRPLYEQLAEELEMPVFAVCIADFFKAPKISSINQDRYNGRMGDPIVVDATDNVGVVRVDVVLSDQAGTLIESGQAVRTAAGSRHWVYTATETIDHGTTVQIQATAIDRPGGAGVKRETKQV